jgi:hypothetical protein
MISPNEAVVITKKCHEDSYREARETWVPYWTSILEKNIVNAANRGEGKCKFELRWAERLGCKIPSRLIITYTESILNEEVLPNSGYHIVKKSVKGDATTKYEIVWLTDDI